MERFFAPFHNDAAREAISADLISKEIADHAAAVAHSKATNGPRIPSLPQADYRPIVVFAFVEDAADHFTSLAASLNISADRVDVLSAKTSGYVALNAAAPAERDHGSGDTRDLRVSAMELILNEHGAADYGSGELLFFTHDMPSQFVVTTARRCGVRFAAYARRKADYDVVALVPDYSFALYNPFVRFDASPSAESQSMSWDDVVAASKVVAVTPSTKNAAYFRGAAFSSDGIREAFTRSSFRDHLVQMDVPPSRADILEDLLTPEEMSARGSHLLDMVGHGPWSTRTKFIAALGSSIVVRLVPTYYTWDEESDSFVPSPGDETETLVDVALSRLPVVSSGSLNPFPVVNYAVFKATGSNTQPSKAKTAAIARAKRLTTASLNDTYHIVRNMVQSVKSPEEVACMASLGRQIICAALPSYKDVCASNFV